PEISQKARLGDDVESAEAVLLASRVELHGHFLGETYRLLLDGFYRAAHRMPALTPAIECAPGAIGVDVLIFQPRRGCDEIDDFLEGAVAVRSLEDVTTVLVGDGDPVLAHLVSVKWLSR